jgi:hypothetical protein
MVTFENSGFTFNSASGSPIAVTEKKIRTVVAKRTGMLNSSRRTTYVSTYGAPGPSAYVPL